MVQDVLNFWLSWIGSFWSVQLFQVLFWIFVFFCVWELIRRIIHLG